VFIMIQFPVRWKKVWHMKGGITIFQKIRPVGGRRDAQLCHMR